MTTSRPNTARTESLVLIGGGGHALVVAEAAHLAGLVLAGFFDDRPGAGVVRGEPALVHLGRLDELDRLAGRSWILALGDIELRRRVLEGLRRLGAGGEAMSAVHPAAFVSPSAGVGRGVYVGPRAVVHSRATVGEHAIINSGAIVEHDCVIGEGSHIAPGAVLGGGVGIGADTLVGLGARVLPSLTIGERCTIGAGAVVTKSVADGVTVAGVPAEVVARPARR